MMNQFFDENAPEYARALAGFESNDKSKLGVIYIENITDKQFWQKIATKHEVKLYSEQGKIITGKSKLLQICSPNQLIAIDSDFDYLCPEHRVESIICSEKNDFILQTYAHGIENILFSPDFLHKVLSEKFYLYLDNHSNPIFNLFETLSDIWYSPYKKFLYLLNCQNTDFQHQDWITVIQLNGEKNFNISQAYREKVAALDNKLNQSIDNPNKYNDFCEKLVAKGFSQTNIYAFIRCHDFKDSCVMPMMKEIIRDRQEKEKAYIEKQFADGEIGNRKKEVANFFKNENSLATVLHQYFYDVYFEHAKQNDFFVKKIVGKYQTVLAMA